MGETKPFKRGYQTPKTGPPRERLEKWLALCKTSGNEGFKGHDTLVNKLLTLETVEFTPTESNPYDACVVFSFEVVEELCNMTGNLHGGAVALIFDITTSMAIMTASREGFWDTGSLLTYGHVSRTLNCTYLRPAPAGAKIFVESRIVHLGKRLAQTVGTMRLGAPDGKICYTCEHGKAAVGASSL